ncbi:hypothetical protein pb186bvf_008334 [Paramecium bursaria]
MSKLRKSSSVKSKDDKIQRAVQKIQEKVNNPPLDVTSAWIKEQASEVKQLLQKLLHKGENVPKKFDLLDQLSQIRTYLSELNKKRKRNDLLKTPVSNQSRRSNKLNKSKSSSKVSRASKSKRKKSLTQNTPRFKKKQYQTKLGSFAKELSKQPSLKRSASQKHSPSVSSYSQSSKKKRAFSPSDNESSSISLSSELKEAVNLRMNNGFKQKYQAFMENEKKNGDPATLTKEENLLLTTKMESVTKERLLREYRILYYRSKEIRKLLAEYYDKNLQLNDQIEEIQRESLTQQQLNKQLKKEIKEQTKEIKLVHTEYTQKIDQLNRTFQQQEYHTIPIQEFDRLKQDYEKLIIELQMIKEYNKQLQVRLQLQDDLSAGRRKYDAPIDYNDINSKLQKELELQREQYEKLKEDSENNIQKLHQSYQEQENQRYKEYVSVISTQKNQESLLYNAQQRIIELESELRINYKQEQDYKHQLQEVRSHLERAQLRVDQYESRIQEQNCELRELTMHKQEYEEQVKQLKQQIQQLQKEIDQMDRIKDNYKNKYLYNKFENKKLVNQYNEKENIIKQSYISEIDRIKSEKEYLEKVKSQEEQQRCHKDKKLKVINDLQMMIKDHKRNLETK